MLRWRRGARETRHGGCRRRRSAINQRPAARAWPALDGQLAHKSRGLRLQSQQRWQPNVSAFLDPQRRGTPHLQRLASPAKRGNLTLPSEAKPSDVQRRSLARSIGYKKTSQGLPDPFAASTLAGFPSVAWRASRAVRHAELRMGKNARLRLHSGPMRIGVDLGGTKIEAAVLDSAGQMVLRQRVHTPQGNYDETVEALAKLVEACEVASGAKASVGVGIPGAVSPATGLVKNANSTCLNGQPLAEDLERRLGRTVRLANDANCFALSEAADGAGARCRRGLRRDPRHRRGRRHRRRRRVLTGAQRDRGRVGPQPAAMRRAGGRAARGRECYCGKQRLRRDVSLGAGAGARTMRAHGRGSAPGADRRSAPRRATRGASDAGALRGSPRARRSPR